MFTNVRGSEHGVFSCWIQLLLYQQALFKMVYSSIENRMLQYLYSTLQQIRLILDPTKENLFPNLMLLLRKTLTQQLLPKTSVPFLGRSRRVSNGFFGDS
jgi:hypothetical protein